MRPLSFRSHRPTQEIVSGAGSSQIFPVDPVAKSLATVFIHRCKIPPQAYTSDARRVV